MAKHRQKKVNLVARAKRYAKAGHCKAALDEYDYLLKSKKASTTNRLAVLRAVAACFTKKR